MSLQIHTDDLVIHWRVSSITIHGRLLFHGTRRTLTGARELAQYISTLADMREAWIRPVITNGAMGLPVAYFAHGREVS